MTRILVVGDSSTIGSALVTSLRLDGTEVVTTTRNGSSDGSLKLDLAMPLDAWPSFPSLDAAIICAGETSLARCEANPSETRRLNVDAIFEVARRARDAGALVVFPSTNLVFDGTIAGRSATDHPNPTTEYGRQKALAESRLGSLGGKIAIIRLSKVVHKNWPLFLGWRRNLRAGIKIDAFEDMWFSPISLDLATATIAAITKASRTGMFQLSAKQDITYLAAARYLAKRLKLPEALVAASSALRSGLTANMTPHHTTLDCKRAKAELGIAAPDAIETLDYLIDQMAKQ